MTRRPLGSPTVAVKHLPSGQQVKCGTLTMIPGWGANVTLSPLSSEVSSMVINIF